VYHGVGFIKVLPISRMHHLAQRKKVWAMRVVVTGACGKLGRAVVSALSERGIDVLSVDKGANRAGERRCHLVDLDDLGQVYGALAGADAAIHLAAIPNPLGHPPEVVFRNNVFAQFNVFEAAATLGVHRVVSASSVSALGFPFQHRWSEPHYVPINEEHPLLPQDAYGLSKATGEEIAAAYCRRGAGSAASLRFSTILAEDSYQQFITDVRRDPRASAHLLWSYVDLRDAVQACLLALTAPFDGHQPLFITADDTTADVPTDALLARYFPNVPRHMPAADGAITHARWSLLDGARAAEVLGYRPQHSWQEALTEQTTGV